MIVLDEELLESVIPKVAFTYSEYNSDKPNVYGDMNIQMLDIKVTYNRKLKATGCILIFSNEVDDKLINFHVGKDRDVFQHAYRGRLIGINRAKPERIELSTYDEAIQAYEYFCEKVKSTEGRKRAFEEIHNIMKLIKIESASYKKSQKSQK